MSKELSALLALERRLPVTHALYPIIYKEMYKKRAGFGGEQEYDRHMKEVRTDYPHAIIHDLSLQHEGVYFQIDSLFIAPDSIIISEIKNRTGKIIIKADPTQFIQIAKDADSILFRSPIVEVERKRQLLKRWLTKRNVQIPIHGIVVFAHNNELQFEKNPEMPIMTGYEAPVYFRARELGIPVLDEKKIKRLATTLVQGDKPYEPGPLSTRYAVSKHDLVKGVLCPICPEATIMQWEKLRWNCARCGETSSVEHEKALYEWFLILSETITNKAFREFTGIVDRHTAKRLLARSQLHRKGERAGSIYVNKK